MVDNYICFFIFICSSHVSLCFIPNSLTSSKPILCLTQASTKELNVAGEKTTILAGLNFKKKFFFFLNIWLFYLPLQLEEKELIRANQLLPNY